VGGDLTLATFPREAAIRRATGPVCPQVRRRVSRHRRHGMDADSDRPGRAAGAAADAAAGRRLFRRPAAPASRAPGPPAAGIGKPVARPARRGHHARGLDACGDTCRDICRCRSCRTRRTGRTRGSGCKASTCRADGASSSRRAFGPAEPACPRCRTHRPLRGLVGGARPHGRRPPRGRTVGRHPGHGRGLARDDVPVDDGLVARRRTEPAGAPLSAPRAALPRRAYKSVRSFQISGNSTTSSILRR